MNNLNLFFYLYIFVFFNIVISFIVGYILRYISSQTFYRIKTDNFFIKFFILFILLSITCTFIFLFQAFFKRDEIIPYVSVYKPVVGPAASIINGWILFNNQPLLSKLMKDLTTDSHNK